MSDVEHDRHLMVERQVARRGVRDEGVLEAMRRVPRECFVPEAMQEFAYEDSPLPIEEGQTISQPFIVALMVQAAALKPGDRVLEIGAGSGYAAAVMAEIADRVWAVERRPKLAELARRRLERLGYDNVEIVAGDGTLGLPDAAPFDAVVAAAGGPEVPQTWREQLAVGGRLVMPVGDEPRRQRLMKLVRTSETEWAEEDLGDVMFVPLIGEHGWTADEKARTRDRREAEPKTFRAPRELPLAEAIAAAAEPLPAFGDAGFAPLFDRFADRRVVLLGEASHGTSDFYRARDLITRRLIEAHGFSIVAVEADWPDAGSIDRYVRHRPALAHAEPPFRRFPTWMWRNTDVERFTEWLRGHNETRPAEQRAGFYGLDLYNMRDAITAVIDYLDRVDPEAAEVARERYGCLTPWSREPAAYGRMAVTSGFAFCEDGVVAMLRELLENRLQYAGDDSDGFLDAAQNARLVRNAEAYYRAMYYGSAESWNARDTHMFETLQALLEARGPEAKAVVWAHNSHIGDARHTDMGEVREQLNIGQLCRQHFGREAALIGFGTHGGTVACASDWDEPMEVKTVNPSRPDSYERLAHDSGVDRFLLDLSPGVHEALRRRLEEPLLERFIGVIYRPDTERWSHYSECVLPRQFDAYVWFDQTEAVTPLPTGRRHGAPDTWPSGM